MDEPISLTRGCGKREKGGLYACSATGRGGRPLEEFVVDPPIPWEAGPFQGIQLRERKDDSGIVDLIDWVGASFYPFAPDFAEEGRVHGFSTRIPVNDKLDYSVLTPYSSAIVYVHPKVIPMFSFRLANATPNERAVPGINRPALPGSRCEHSVVCRPACTFATWDLSALENVAGKHDCEDEDEGLTTIVTPSTTYLVRKPEELDVPDGMQYEPGIFLRVPMSHLDFIGSALPQPVANALGDNVDNTRLCKE